MRIAGIDDPAPAHGARATGANLQAWRDILQDAGDRVQSAINRGEALDAVVASQPAGADRLQGDAGRLVAAIHDSLATPGSRS